MQLSGDKSLDMPSVESSLRRCAEGSGNHSETHFSTIFRDFMKGVINGSIFRSFFTSFFSHFYCERFLFDGKNERKMD